MKRAWGDLLRGRRTLAEGWQLLLLFCAALLLFQHLFGLTSLDPRQTAWMLQGDPAQHYLGWQFFRHEPWQWPPGRIAGFGLPAGTSIVFTDSIPLLALFFKPLESFLPAEFQYFGLWILACYYLNGLTAWCLLGAFTPNPALRLLAALFFLLSPPLMVRAYGHEALMAHWLVLLGFLGYLRPWHRWRWLLLLSLAALTHAYLLLMLLGLWAGRALQHGAGTSSGAWRQVLGEAAIMLPGLAGMMYLAGYFVPGGGAAAAGYGFFSMNLLALIQPNFLDARFGDSPLWAGPSVATGGQYEGYLYLGAGLICLSLIVMLTTLLGCMARRRIFSGEASHPAPGLAFWGWLGVISALYWLLALSSQITAGPHTLLTLSLPPAVEAGLSTFRASGRLGWPLYYLLSLLVLVAVMRIFPVRYSLPLLALALLLQLHELQPKHLALQRFIEQRHQYSSPLAAPEWQSWAQAARHLLVLPQTQELESIYIPFAHLAAQHQLATNAAHTARAAASTQAAHAHAAWSQLQQGRADAQTLYVIASASVLDTLPPQLHAALQWRDGYYVLPPAVNN